MACSDVVAGRFVLHRYRYVTCVCMDLMFANWGVRLCEGKFEVWPVIVHGRAGVWGSGFGVRAWRCSKVDDGKIMIDAQWALCTLARNELRKSAKFVLYGTRFGHFLFWMSSSSPPSPSGTMMWSGTHGLIVIGDGSQQSYFFVTFLLCTWFLLIRRSFAFRVVVLVAGDEEEERRHGRRRRGRRKLKKKITEI